MTASYRHTAMHNSAPKTAPFAGLWGIFRRMLACHTTHPTPESLMNWTNQIWWAGASTGTYPRYYVAYEARLETAAPPPLTLGVTEVWKTETGCKEGWTAVFVLARQNDKQPVYKKRDHENTIGHDRVEEDEVKTTKQRHHYRERGRGGGNRRLTKS